MEVVEILHFDKDPANWGQSQQATPAQQLPCHVNVMCYGPDRVHPLARDAVAGIGFIGVREGGFFCTGTLLNDQDPETTVPYFLTAYHCGIRPANVGSAEVSVPIVTARIKWNENLL